MSRSRGDLSNKHVMLHMERSRTDRSVISITATAVYGVIWGAMVSHNINVHISDDPHLLPHSFMQETTTLRELNSLH